MKNFYQKIKNTFLSLKMKNIKHRLESITKKLNPSGRNISSDASGMKLDAGEQAKIKEIKENISSICQQTGYETEKLLAYVEAANTPIYCIKNAEKYLHKIGLELGFISEQKGIIALYLSLLTTHKFCLKTSPMFVLGEQMLDKYTALHSFYKWYSYRAGLKGFEYDAQKKFKQYLENNSKEAIQKLNLDDIEKLRHAIKRDQEATDFVLEYAQSQEGSQKVIDKIKNSGGAEV